MADSASNSAINIPETINLCSEIEDSNSNVDDSEMIDTTVFHIRGAMVFDAIVRCILRM